MLNGNEVALYIRVSTKQQVETGHSLQAQEAILREDVQRRGKTVYKVYCDAGQSGVLEDRKAFNQLLKDAKQGCFSEVLVWTVSRISRKLSYLLKIIEELKDLEVAFCSLSEKFDATTPLGQFTLSMMGAVAEMQRTSWMESSRIGMEKRTKSGRFNGGLMLGYQSVPDEADPRGGNKLVIMPQEAQLVQKIFALCLDGRGYKAIATQLNTKGWAGKMGKAFSIQAVRTILHNVAYIGKVRFGDLLEQGNHEPIISLKVWEQAQQLMDKRAMPVQKIIKRKYLLAGVLRCPCCGQGMVPFHHNGKRKDGSLHLNYYYICSAYLNKGKAVCRPNLVRAVEADETVLTWLENFFNRPFWVHRLWQSIQQKQAQQVLPGIEEKRLAEAELAKIVKKQKSLLKCYEENRLDRDEMVQQMQVLTKKKEENHKLIDSYSDLSEPTELWTLEEARAELAGFRQIFRQADFADKRRLIQVLIAKITVNEQREVNEIALNVPLKDRPEVDRQRCLFSVAN